MSGHSPDDPPDLSPATVALLVRLWREHANDNDPMMMPGYLSAACTCIDALAADLARVTAERDAALSTLAAARRARVADDVADRLAHMRDGAR